MTVSDYLDADTIEALHGELDRLARDQDQAVVALVDAAAGVVTAVERVNRACEVRWMFRSRPRESPGGAGTRCPGRSGHPRSRTL